MKHTKAARSGRRPARPQQKPAQAGHGGPRHHPHAAQHPKHNKKQASGPAHGRHKKPGRAKAAPDALLAHGYTPDDVDARDHVYIGASTAEFVDLPDMPAVWQQGDQESCVRYAAVALWAYAGGSGPWPLVADESQVRDAVKACAVTLGVEYLAVGDLRACLSGGLPVVFGVTLFESFVSAAAQSSGVVVPAAGEDVIGPHCMVAVGFGYGRDWIAAGQFLDADPDTHYVKARNSWGSDVYQGGYLLLPSAYLQRHGADFWTMRST